MNVDIIQATLDDAPAILALQQIAYDKDAQLYDDWSTPPQTQTLPELQDEFDKCVFAKATFGDQIIGSVRAKTISDTCMIRRLLIHPEFRHDGIRTSLIQSIEVLSPSAKRFELFTSAKNTEEIQLYEQLGYAVYRHEDLSPIARLVFMGKSI